MSSSWRAEPQPPTRSMLHRNPDPDCGLCGLWGVPWVNDRPDTWNQQHAHAELLWREWAAGGPDWPQRVAAVAARLGVHATPQQARTHFSRHGVEQPAMSGSLDRERLLMLAQSLNPRLQQIILTVYRQRLLTTAQVRELFYRPTLTDAAATKKAKEDLLALAQNHILYRYLPTSEIGRRRGAPPRLARQAIWFLGKAAVPYVEHVTGLTVWRDQYIQMAKEVRPTTIIHDLRTVGLYVAIHRALRERRNILNLPTGTPAVVQAMPVNWYGPKHLAIAFYDRERRQDREVRPDGFFTLSLPRTNYLTDDALPSCQLPCFLEYDRASREVSHVVDQLYTYHLLARSQRALERFPQLNVNRYAIPVVMVFSDADRMRLVHRRLREKVTDAPVEGAPIFLCAEPDWLQDPFTDDLLLSAWHDDSVRISLLDMLVRASRQLIAARAAWAEQPLTIDMTAARPLPTGTYSDEGMRQVRDLYRAQREANAAPAVAGKEQQPGS